jgi:protein-tyrosine-phosphatase
MTERILFLCAQGSGRALLAASLLQAQGRGHWEAWSTPPSKEQATQVVEQVLQEQGMALLPSDHLILPAFDQHWDQGIVLCSGMTDT